MKLMDGIYELINKIIYFFKKLLKKILINKLLLLA